MLIFSGIVLSIVAFGATFREVEWDEEDYDEEEGRLWVRHLSIVNVHFVDRPSVGEEEETENGNETASIAVTPSELAEVFDEATNAVHPSNEAELPPVNTAFSTPPPSHKPSITDDLVFYDQFTKQELFDQYSKSELCLPLALREQLENEHRQNRLALEEEHGESDFNEPKLSSSTTQIEQTDEKDRAAQVPTVIERSNSCK